MIYISFWIWLLSKRKILILKNNPITIKYFIIRISMPFKKIKLFRKIDINYITKLISYREIYPIFPIGIMYYEDIIDGEDGILTLKVGYDDGI